MLLVEHRAEGGVYLAMYVSSAEKRKVEGESDVDMRALHNGRNGVG